MRALLDSLMLDESGQDMAEYAVLIGLLALAVIAAMRLLGGTVSSLFNSLGSTLATANIPAGS